MVGAERGEHWNHSIRRPRDCTRVPREYRSAVLSLLPAWQRREAQVAGEHISERFQHLAYLSRMAAERGEEYGPVSACRREVVVQRSRCGPRQAISRICFRSCQSGTLPAAADLADLSRG